MKKSYCFCESLSQKLADDKPLNLSEKFWLMHISHSYFDKLTEKVPKEKIDEIKTDIVKNYSDIFIEDFKHFTANILNKLYNELFKEGHCTSSLEKEITLIKQNHSDQKIIVIFLEIVSKIEEIHKCVEALKGYALPKLLDQTTFNIFPSYEICSDVKLLKSFFNKSNNIPALYDDIQKFKLIRNEIWKLDDKIHECTNLIEFITLAFSDDNFKEIKELKCQQTLSYLAKFEYAIDNSFNSELIFLLIWTDYKEYDEGNILTLIIKKYESFFLDIYNQITKVSREVAEILGINITFHRNKISDYHLSAPIFTFSDPHSLSFRLKKIIKFYLLFYNINQINSPESVVKFLKDFDIILIETRFFDISYNDFLDDLPKYVMYFLGINQSDLANILGVDKATISRQFKNNTILRKNDWFWQYTTDFTSTFIKGETTITHYGKNPSNQSRYLQSLVIQTHFGELFLNNLNKIKEHREKLKKCNSVRVNLTRDYLKIISQKVIELEKIIGKHRLNLDDFYNKINEASKELSISKEFGKKFPEDVENSKKQLDETKQQFQSHLDALVKNLDSCINKLQYETP